MRETSKKVLFWALMFFGAFLLLTQVGYSDGDDAFFYQYTHEMGFFEYLSWRYQTWVGRMSGEDNVHRGAFCQTYPHQFQNQIRVRLPECA